MVTPLDTTHLFEGRLWAPVAQLVERLTFNEDVHGSSPCGRTIPSNQSIDEFFGNFEVK